MTFGLDKEGKPFYTVDLAKIEYEDFEEITLPNGKKINRRIMRQYEPKPLKKTPSEMGWLKKVTFETVVLLHTANPKNHYKLEPTLLYRKYLVDAEKYANSRGCAICAHNGLGPKFHFLRSMPQGIYSICWLNAVKHGRSASGPIQLHVNREGKTSKWVKLIEEKKVSKAEAKRIFARLQKMPSVAVSMFLSGADMSQ